MQTVNII